MATIQPIDARAWEEEGRLVPAGPAAEAADLAEELDDKTGRWRMISEPFEHKGGYLFVAALGRPEGDDPPRYFAVTLPTEYQAGRVLGRALADPLAALRRVVAPAEERLERSWRDTRGRFVTLGELARETGHSPELLGSWREEPGFPPAVLERGGDPLFVREEIEEWLRANGS